MSIVVRLCDMYIRSIVSVGLDRLVESEFFVVSLQCRALPQPVQRGSLPWWFFLRPRY